MNEKKDRKIGLLCIPKPILEGASYVTDALYTYECDFCRGVSSEYVGVYNHLKVLSIAISLILKQTSPIFSPDNEQLALLGYKLSDEEIESDAEIVFEQSDASTEIVGDYLCYVDDTLHSLTQYGWEFKGEYYFSNYFSNREEYLSIPYEKYKEYRVAAYNEYFDPLISHNAYGQNITTAKIYINKRLGQFYNYCHRYNLNNELTQEITAQVSKILQFWGIEYNLNRIAEDGFESVYIITDDYGYFPNNEQYAYAQADICLPIHAYNLEKLLDKAFELYPIEKEEKYGERKD